MYCNIFAIIILMPMNMNSLFFWWGGESHNSISAGTAIKTCLFFHLPKFMLRPIVVLDLNDWDERVKTGCIYKIL